MMDKHVVYPALNKQRRAAVLLHPTSLPGSLSRGDIGHQAYRFIEFLHACGFKVWQMLPLCPTHDDHSPYQCLSSHAGDPALISLDWLQDKGWLDKNILSVTEREEHYRLSCLKHASAVFYRLGDSAWLEKLSEFKQQHAIWLDDYALFMALKNRYQNKPWYDWPALICQRDVDALKHARQQLQRQIEHIIFEQFIFFTQWYEIRDYAKQHDIELFGDMPLFVAQDSADVWARRENFLMDQQGRMTFVAGVPPDAFSVTGQRWGNPLYDWDYMKSTNFIWWKERFATQLMLFDMIRFDHFRGLQACWHIPAQDETAVNGAWVKVPGDALLSELRQSFHHLPLVVEDLGVITDAVVELKASFDLPGMKVLQFAFAGNNNNPHLPHCYTADDVVYTGTHDNDTTLGWLNDEKNYHKEYFNDYLGLNTASNEQAVWAMIRLAMSSVAFLCVIPMQDFLMLDATARMNIPGTVKQANWCWRFEWQQVSPEQIEKFAHLNTLYLR